MNFMTFRNRFSEFATAVRRDRDIVLRKDGWQKKLIDLANVKHPEILPFVNVEEPMLQITNGRPQIYFHATLPEHDSETLVYISL